MGSHYSGDDIARDKYDQLQVMETITAKFHQNPLGNVGGIAKTSTSVDKPAKTYNGP